MGWVIAKMRALRQSPVGQSVVRTYDDIRSKTAARLPGRLPAWLPCFLFIPPGLLWLTVLLLMGFGLQWPIWIVAGWAPKWAFLLFGLVFPAIALWLGAYRCHSTTTGDGLVIGFGGLFFIVLMLFTGFVPIG